MVSPQRQRLIIVALLGLAFAAIVTASVFSAPTEPAAVVFAGSAADGGGDRADQDGGAAELLVNPVEGWLPAAGDGTACSERVGVDLIPGYAATLEINGIQIPIEEMNNDAGASLGQYTWGPEEDCPFGSVLRPTDNRVVACIYRHEEGPENCVLTEQPGGFDF